MDYFSTNQLIKPSKGDLLISEPYLPDPNFERTVVFLCEHDENGTFGLVLNKKAHANLGEMISEIGSFKSEVFLGGPVERDTLHFIHREPALASSGNQVLPDTYWGGNYDHLLQMINVGSISPSDIRFFVGYSGWAAGQLMDELKAKSWIVLKNPTQEMIFDWDNQELWKECLKKMGGKFKIMANYPQDPRLN